MQFVFDVKSIANGVQIYKQGTGEYVAQGKSIIFSASSSDSKSHAILKGLDLSGPFHLQLNIAFRSPKMDEMYFLDVQSQNAAAQNPGIRFCVKNGVLCLERGKVFPQLETLKSGFRVESEKPYFMDILVNPSAEDGNVTWKIGDKVILDAEGQMKFSGAEARRLGMPDNYDSIDIGLTYLGTHEKAAVAVENLTGTKIDK